MGKKYKKLLVAVFIIGGMLSSANVGFANSTGFIDVDNSNPYAPYILDLQSKGIVTGTGNGMYSPSNQLSRAEFVKLIVTAFQLPLDKSHFHFSDLNGHWAANYIQTAWDNGIVSGVSAYTFDPDSPITREQAATMVWKYLKTHGVSPSVQKFILPNTVDEWAREGVAQCIAKNLFGIPFQKGSFQDKMTRQEAAALIDFSIKQTIQSSVQS